MTEEEKKELREEFKFFIDDYRTLDLLEVWINNKKKEWQEEAVIKELKNLGNAILKRADGDIEVYPYAHGIVEMLELRIDSIKKGEL